MDVLNTLNQHILSGKVLDVQVGLFRTAVVVETKAGIRCGLAATLLPPNMMHCREVAIRQAGCLHSFKGKELADMVYSDHPAEVSIGLAAINALLPPMGEDYILREENAEDYIIRTGKGKKVAVVGHFPFVDHLPNYTQQSWCLELEPKTGDLPASLAPEILPQADMVSITATTLINHTLDNLLPYCRPDAEVMLLGPSTPLSPVLFDTGITMLSGIEVDEPMKVVIGISQGATLRQLYQEGWIRYVNARKDNWNGIK